MALCCIDSSVFWRETAKMRLDGAILDFEEKITH